MPTQSSTADIRTWAIEQGIEVADRGRISAEVRQAYADAHKASTRQRQPSPRKPTQAAAEVPRQEPPAAEPDKTAERLAEVERRMTGLQERVQQLEAGRSRRRFGKRS